MYYIINITYKKKIYDATTIYLFIFIVTFIINNIIIKYLTIDNMKIYVLLLIIIILYIISIMNKIK